MDKTLEDLKSLSLSPDTRKALFNIAEDIFVADFEKAEKAIKGLLDAH